MDVPVFSGDFNDAVGGGAYLLARNDEREDFYGRMVRIENGMRVRAMDPDEDEAGNPVDLVRDGHVVPNPL